MPKFHSGSSLNLELENIFRNADEQLVLISPYIKLHDRFKDILKQKLNEHKLKLTIVFGKNEEDLGKSISAEDINFFSKFPNVEIRYEKRLHSKFYANDYTALFTSMNLYSYSQDNNIEFGISTEASILGNLAKNILSIAGEQSFDKNAFEHFSMVIENSDLLFQRIPKYESKFLNLGKKYIDSETNVDDISRFFHLDIPLKAKYIQKTGYCIRTGKQIPFNIKNPMCDSALRDWSKSNDKYNPENYCHYSGEPSSGETSMTRPILRMYWDEARFIHHF